MTDTENYSEATASIGTKVARENLKQNKRIVDSIESVLLDETISKMIEIRDKKLHKLSAQADEDNEDVYLNEDETDDYEKSLDEMSAANKSMEEESPRNLKIYIPSIDLDEDNDTQDIVASAIANKPNSISSTHRSSELKEKMLVQKIPYKKERIDQLIDTAIESYFWERLVQNQHVLIDEDTIEELVEHVQLEGYFKAEVLESEPNKSDDNKEIEFNFKKMLLDLVGELLHDLYLEKYEPPKSISSYFPGILRQPKKQHFKSAIKGPGLKRDAQQMVKQKVGQLLKLNVNTESFRDTKPLINAKSKWRMQKRLDLVDNLLDTEMREQEHDWSNYELEEYEAKILISNTIFDLILKDTVDCFQLNLLKKTQHY